MRGSRRPFPVGLAALSILVCAQAWASPATPVPIAPGATYTRIYRPNGPYGIHVVEADLSQQYLALRSPLGGGETMERRPLGEMAAAAAAARGMRPVAGVNGDFFALAGGNYAAVPLGLHVEDGEFTTFPVPTRSVFYLLGDGSAHIGRFRPNAWLQGPAGLLFPLKAMNRPPGYADLVLFTPRFGKETRADEDTLHLSLSELSGPMRPNARVKAKIARIAVAESQPIPPEGAVLAARGVAAYGLRHLEVGDEVALSLLIEPDVGRMAEAISGGPRLLRGGLISVEHVREGFSEAFAQRPHPRTGLGLRDGTLVLVVVDGRQPGYSSGMTLYQMADLLRELGCTEAMNLDGGGSTTMLVRDEIVNSPSSGVARAVANGLILFTSAPAGPPRRLTVEPTAVSILSAHRIQLRAVALDEYYNPTTVASDDVEWRCSTALGQVDGEGMFTAADVSRPVAGAVTGRLGELAGRALVRVLPAPDRVVVIPDSATLLPGATRRFLAYAYDERGRPIHLPESQVVWSCDPDTTGCTIDDTGMLLAPQQDLELAVTATVSGVRGTAEVIVGSGLPALEDFERRGVWFYQGRPPGVPGAVEWAEDPLRPDNHCLRLHYDFSQHGGTRTANAVLGVALPDTGALSLRVLGDGRGAWLRARVRDATGRPFALDLSPHVNWSNEWRWLTAEVPAGVALPVTLESVYLAEYHDAHRPSGEVYLDDISAAPVAEAVGR